MIDAEKNFNEALQQLQKGYSLQEVLLHFPDDKELQPMLEIALALNQVPKKSVPAPSKRRKYILAPVKSFWLHYLPTLRTASISAAAILLVSSGIGTVYATKASLPGSALFTVKKYAEDIQLQLAANPQAKAKLQVAIAQERLADAQAVLSNPQSAPEQQNAAINELVTETSNSIAAVDSATQNNSSVQAASPILASLENVTAQQQALLQQATSVPQVAQNIQSAIQTTSQNASKVAQLKKIVQAAAEEQTLSTLVADPDTITISGKVTASASTTITVEKTVFAITDSTTIKDVDGNPLQISDIKNKNQVTIIGNKQNDTLNAQVIIALGSSSVVASSTPSTIISTSTSTPSSTPQTIQKPEESTTTPKKILDKTPEADTTPQDVIGGQTDIATGSFIPEDPTPLEGPAH